MITAPHFTSAASTGKPDVPGTYLCLLKYAGTTEVFYALAEYSKRMADAFVIIGQSARPVEVLGWLHIENAATVAELLKLINESE